MPATAKLPISVVLITLNAEKTLLQTLASVVDWAGEIVLVDSGSTDGTLTIARIMGCRIYHRAFDGYGSQKNDAVSRATFDWILSLDADEVVSEELQGDIRRVMNIPPTPQQAFSVPRSLIFLGHRMRHGGEHRRPIIRLFNRQRSRISSATVHEQVEGPDSVVPLRGELLHNSYLSLDDYFEKMNRYTSFSAREMAASDRRISLWALPFRFVFSFLFIFVAKGSFRDGYPGFLWALLSALYPVVKYTKLMERRAEAVLYPAPEPVNS